jgi:mannose-6-phosphate isomerase-like protein (cupin superfamily)
MSGLSAISIIGPGGGTSRSIESGTERVICSEPLCGAKHLTAYDRVILSGRRWSVQAGGQYHLIYVMRSAAGARIQSHSGSHAVDVGSGALLAPGEEAAVEAGTSDLQLLHLIIPKPPAAVEATLPDAPGYYFDRRMLPVLRDASGGRIRRFCAESSIRLPDNRRLTSTNAIQAGEMHYNAGGASPYHMHVGTDANPEGPDHCYITFKGGGRVEVSGEFADVAPGTLIYFPPGVPHRLQALDGPLDYFEVQAWRSFKTKILSEEPLGLKWFYESADPDAKPAEWNQS